MHYLGLAGRYIFLTSMLGLSALFFFFGYLPETLFPFGHFTATDRFFQAAIAIITASLSIMIMVKFKPRLASSALGFLFFVIFLVAHLSKMMHASPSSGIWTAALQLLAFSGGAWILAGTLPSVISGKQSQPRAFNLLITSGKFLFALTLLDFGIRHFIYVEYISSLIPSWIPARRFWSWLTGAAFILVAVTILLQWWATRAAVLLAVMVTIWILLVHVPETIARPGDIESWSGIIVALAMTGTSLVLASAFKEKGN